MKKGLDNITTALADAGGGSWSLAEGGGNQPAIAAARSGSSSMPAAADEGADGFSNNLQANARMSVLELERGRHSHI
jgi:hypothetical protein